MKKKTNALKDKTVADITCKEYREGIADRIGIAIHRFLQKNGVLAVAEGCGEKFIYTQEYFMNTRRVYSSNDFPMELIGFFDDGYVRRFRLSSVPVIDTAVSFKIKIEIVADVDTSPDTVEGDTFDSMI